MLCIFMCPLYMNLFKNNFFSKSIIFLKDGWKNLTISIHLSDNVFYPLLVIWILITRKCNASSDVEYSMDVETKTTTKAEVYLFMN